MTNKKSELVTLVNKENVSAIRILADRLEISFEEVRDLIEELLAAGTIQGSITDDGERFFKSEIKLSDAPVIPGGDPTPTFMKFDTRPGIITSIIGLVLIASALIVDAIIPDIVGQDYGSIIIIVGIVVLFSGLYCLSRRETPS